MRVSREGEVRVSVPLGTPQGEVEAFVSAHTDWIERASARVGKARAQADAFYDGLPLTTREECRNAIARLDAIIPALVEHHAAHMNVHPLGFSYTRARTRWGSCNVHTRHLNFSVYLLLLPVWCIEHVVVHELAHLIVPNHSAAFYRVMDRHFPRWREARAETRRIARTSATEDDER